jgi:putative addiction module component (TIGR02574 family)
MPSTAFAADPRTKTERFTFEPGGRPEVAPQLAKSDSGRSIGPMVDQGLLEQAKNLDVAGRIELINELWGTIDADALPVSDDVAALIDQRLAEADAEPLVGRSWEEVEADLRSKLR